MQRLYDIGDDQHRDLLARFGRTADRRSFLKWTGAAGVGLALAACSDDPSSPVAPNGGALGVAPRGTHFLSPTNDTEILQFALFLELLEAEFYRLAVSAGILSGKVLEVSTNVRDHEQDHVDFLQAALGGDAFGQDDVVFDFSAVLTDQATFLDAAQAFEQTGVGAYLGALPLIQSKELRSAGGTIATIEARHTAAFRAMNGESKPAPVAFETPLTPSQVVDRINPFVVSAMGTP
ncbi:ferritin-like domain-containing protein [soil metagenome]